MEQALKAKAVIIQYFRTLPKDELILMELKGDGWKCPLAAKDARSGQVFERSSYKFWKIKPIAKNTTVQPTRMIRVEKFFQNYIKVNTS